MQASADCKHNESDASMSRLTTQDRVHFLTVVSESMGINAVCRATGASRGTVLKLLPYVGGAWRGDQDREIRNLSVTQLQVDQIWSFVGCKQKNVPADADLALGLGDCYTFTSIDRVEAEVPLAGWLPNRQVRRSVLGRSEAASGLPRAAQHQ